MTSDARIQEVLQYAEDHGDAEACKMFGMKEATLTRYRVKAGHTIPVSGLLKDIKEKYSEGELRSILRGHGLARRDATTASFTFTGQAVRFWFATDLHMGSETYRPEFLEAVLAEAKAFKAQFGVIAGDVTEGLSTRPGHVYELTHIGYASQLAYAVEQLSKWKGKLYCISGNHDAWFKKSNGAEIVEDICKQLPDAEYLGYGEGNKTINGIQIRLWHGEDASSYATSYRIQKIVESLTGGDKPNILLCGHSHKQAYLFERHIHCVSGGALCKQSSYMRMKRLANHAGFWMIEFSVGNGGVSKFSPTWYPFYE